MSTTTARPSLPDGALGPDDDVPDELLPEGGLIATDRTQVRTVVLTSILPPDPSGDGGSAGPVPPATDDRLTGQVDLATSRPALYATPAEGVVITTQQEWTPRRLGLGRLLHSLPLAPGESTRVAVLDWTRRTAAASSERTTQAESLAEDALRDRGVTEITEALLTEEQEGRSTVSSDSGSRSFGGSVGALFFGASASGSSSSGRTTSVSRSSGSRNLSAKTAQRISERTQQLATSLRDRRASVVRETVEAESATASTRVVTNYNHMHSLTVQYWEVVQEYAVRTLVAKVERCLFVPMKVIDFDGPAFRRFAAVLAAAAPPGRWADRLGAIDPSALGTFRTRPSWSGEPPWVFATPAPGPSLRHFQVVGPSGPVIGVTDTYQIFIWEPEAHEWVFQPRPPLRGGVTYQVNRDQLIATPTGKPGVATPLAIGPEGAVGGTRYAFRDGRLVMRRNIEQTPLDDVVPGTSAEKLMVWSDGRGIVRVELRMRGGDAAGAGAAYAIGSEPPRDSGVQLAECAFREDDRLTSVVLVSEPTEWGHELRQVRVATTGAPETVLGTAPEVADAVDLDVREGWLCGLFGTSYLGDDGLSRVATLGFRVTAPGVAQDVLDHLNDNALHYSRAIWASADELTLSPIMAMRMRADDPVPLGLQLDPDPIAMTGNYLGFLWHFPDDDARRQWLRDNKLEEGPGTAVEITVPLPSDGVFAEAVLGRSNAAEKLDITRFWDWQSSPIPIIAPEISPVSTASRSGAVDTSTGQLAPVAATLTPMTALPAPTGLAASLGALTASSVFRDMSGLAEASAVLQKGIEAATTADTAAAANATKAMEVAGDNIAKVAKAATEAASAIAPVLGGPAGLGASALGSIGPSFLGALLNVGDGEPGESATTGEGA